MLVFCAYNESVNVSIFSTNYKHAYICTYIYYSNDFDLHKIQVTQDLLEQNNYVCQKASVL